MRIFSDLQVPLWDRVLPYPVDAEMREATTYGIPGLSGLGFALPSVSKQLGLKVHQDVQHMVPSEFFMTTGFHRKERTVPAFCSVLLL